MEKKLSKEDIQFIDTYLSNSDIHYEDIRIEMIDHVASEIEHQINQGDERDFYHIFKEYMIENKVYLEKQGKPFKWRVFKSVCLRFLKNLYHWNVILGSAASLFLFMVIDQYVYKIDGVASIFFPAVLMVAIGFIPILFFKKKKFSFIGNFTILMGCFFYLNQQFGSYLEYHSTIYFINLSIQSIFFVCGFKTMLELTLYYKKRFQFI